MVSINVIAVIVTDNMVTLSWPAPTEWTDNSPLSLLELGGYKIYSGSPEHTLNLIATITAVSM